MKNRKNDRSDASLHVDHLGCVFFKYNQCSAAACVEGVSEG